jgi:beta-1,4-mannosyl-glycoprotein beta-1,4-N-acetylglucosaminyltransferase
MIIDVFLFNNEIELLELRLRENWDLFDKFIIIEGNRTFQGKEKNSILDKQVNKKRFQWANKKIIRHTASLSSSPCDQWENEKIQLNFMTQVIKEYKNDDRTNLFVTGDCDEIVNKFAIREIIKKKIKLPVALLLNSYYYYLNGRLVNIHKFIPGNLVLKKENLDIKNIFQLRREKLFEIKKYVSCSNIASGWHFSFLGGVKKIIKKLEEYSHSEYNNKKFKNKNKIKKHIENGTDIFERKEGHEHFLGESGVIEIVYTPIDKTYPEYILKNLRKYNKYIKKPNTDKISQYYTNLILQKDTIIEEKNKIIMEQNKKLQNSFKKLIKFFLK